MGFFSWAADKISKAKDWVCEKASNVWNTFTGKKNTDEAKRIYKEAVADYERARSDFEKYLTENTKKINLSIDNINNMKKLVFSKYLKEYLEIANKMYTGSVISTETLEKEFEYHHKHINMKSLSSVMKIDFDSNKFKTNLLAICTLGFYTRKKAKESLMEAENVAHEVRLYKTQLEAERARIDSLVISLQNIEVYFKGMIEVVESLLPKLDYSLNMLRNLHLVFSYSFIKGKLDFHKLPAVQMDYFTATNTITKILVEMSKKSYITNNNEVITEDKKVIELRSKEVSQLKEKIGA